MNFIETFKEGKAGLNFGLSTGIPALDEAINGIQKKTSIGLAAAPKCGKTTFADFAFVLSPYLQVLDLEKERQEAIKANWYHRMEEEGWKENMEEELARGSWLDNIQFIYFSYEIDRVSKEYKFAAFFMAHDFGVFEFDYKGKAYEMSGEYLSGKLLHRNEDNKTEGVPVTPEHEEMLRVIYTTRILPLFGEFDKHGRRMSEGKIDFIEEAENPTGIDKYIKSYARKNGRFITESYIVMNEKGEQETKTRTIGYEPRNARKFVIIITDHIRKPILERGFTKKENIDKLLEYHTIGRNMCKFIYVDICHSNRGVTNVERLKMAGEWIYPTADDVKDTGNLAEESTILMTLFNPTDEKYNLDKHFGVELKDHPRYRSLHITESRNTPSPAHIQLEMYGSVNMFFPLTTNTNF